jgi:hypothetical protein
MGGAGGVSVVDADPGTHPDAGAVVGGQGGGTASGGMVGTAGAGGTGGPDTPDAGSGGSGGALTPVVDALAMGVARLGVNMTTVDFGAQPVGATQRSTLFVMVSNVGAEITGTPMLTIDNAAFAISPGGCGVALAPGASCTLLVSFSPPATGSHAGTLSVSATPGGTVLVALAGQGVLSAILVADRMALDFGPVSVGQTSPGQVIKLTNTGGSQTSNLSFRRNIADFLLGTTACTRLDPGQSCNLTVSYRPTVYASNGVRDTLDIQAVNGGRVMIALAGAPQASFFRFEPQTTVNFGTVDVPLMSAPVALRITNLGNEASQTPTLTPQGQNASEIAVLDTDCFGSIPPNEACSFDVALAPTTGGAKVAKLSVGGGSFTDLSPELRGYARQPQGLNINPGFLKLQAGNVNTNVLTVTNNGTAPTGNLAVEGVPLGAPTGYQRWSDGCNNQTLAAGTTCTILVRWHGGALPEGYTRLVVRANPGGETSALLHMK